MIYLDHHAATPLSPEVLAAMRRADEEAWANPSSIHQAGRRARGILERARLEVARAIHAREVDVVLVGGGTEACNLGIRTLVRGIKGILTTEVEHPAVARVIHWAAAQSSVPVHALPVPRGAPPTPEDLERSLVEMIHPRLSARRPAAGPPCALSPRNDAAIPSSIPTPGRRASGAITDSFLPASDLGRIPAPALVAVQWINHETGTIFPVQDYVDVARRYGAVVFVDATQALGKVPIDVAQLGADAIAFAAHKVGGPAGSGALWVAQGHALEPLLRGGDQERGRRAGTPHVAAHAGFGAACTGIEARLQAARRIRAQRDRLESVLCSHGAVVNAAAGPRAHTVVSVSVPGWRGEELVAALDLEGVCASSGPACSSGRSEPSAVIAAMHPSEPWRARSSLRMSLGPEVTDCDVEDASEVVRRVLSRCPTPS